MRIEEWREIIRKHFPEFVKPAEIGLSVICQIAIEDITNPFGLVYVDVPSSGKTITLNFFNDVEGLIYPTDSFTPSAFVSHAASLKASDLEKVDLLPKIKHKTLVVRDMAPIFGMRDDDLLKTMGILTRVFDGEGLMSEGGQHGQRGYQGDYLFMFLGATTPIAPRVWKTMGNFGSRLFFLNMNSIDKSVEDLAEQITGDMSARDKEKICRQATKELVNSIWTIDDSHFWDNKKNDKPLLHEIARIAQLVANLRGTINVWKQDAGDEKYEHTMPIIEKPDRINQSLYNLARGHAFACGRGSLNDEDISVLISVAMSSAAHDRTKFLDALLDAGGVLITEDVIHRMGCSRTTALKLMEMFELLGIAVDAPRTNPHVGRSEKVIKLADKFTWFSSDRFKELRRKKF